VLGLVSTVLAQPALQLEIPFTDSGAGATANAATSALGALSLSLLNNAGAAANFHGVPGSGVSGLNVALDFSTNADFSFAGGDFFGLGPIAVAKTSTALNYGQVKSFTATIWFKPNDSTTWTGNVGPRIYILGTNGVTDKNAANSIGLYYQAANEISFNFNGNEIDPTAGATGPNYTLGQWYFYAVTYDGTTVTGYQGTDGGDGTVGITEVSSGSLPGQILKLGSATSPGSTLQIGNRDSDQERSFDGWFNDFRFYSSTAVTTAATAAQIEDIRWSALAPTGLLATIGNNQNTLTWNAVTGAGSYIVYRSQSLGGPYTQINSGLVTATIYTDSPAPSGTCYYEVAAIDGGGDLTTGGKSQPIVNVQIGPNTVLTNLPATGIAATSATLNGQFLSVRGNAPTVTLYYGTVDGGTNAANWSGSVAVGVATNTFSATVQGLAPTATYFYTAKSVNNLGTNWAVPSTNFATLAIMLPQATNQPATAIGATMATLNGQVVSTGGTQTGIILYYGTADGQTNPLNWAHNIPLGPQTGAYAQTLVGLSSNTVYFFTAEATNAAGARWAVPSLSFTTPATNPPATLVSVLTYKYDNARDGANTNELLLTPANVNVANFSRLFTYALDGYVYSEPLYVANLQIPGQGTHNAVFVATENDSVYAFDADSNAGANGGLLWHTNLGTALVSTYYGVRYHHNVLNPLIGITGTPVIDPASGTLYVDVFSGVVSNTANGFHTLHALNITNGAEQPYSPVLVAASVPGRGVDATNGVVTFAPQNHMNRPALTLAGGTLYVAYGSYGDTDPYHGWVIGFNATNLQQLTNFVFATTPNATIADFGTNAGEGALWMGGAGPCVDAGGNIYFESANGSFSANTNGGDYGDSFVKLSATNGLAVADYFTPFNQASLATGDDDLGSGGPILLPDAAGSVAHPHLIIGAGKDGNLFLVDRDNMGHYNTANNNQIVQQLPGAIGGLYGSGDYFNNLLFFQGAGDVMKAFGITNGVVTSAPVSQSTVGFGSGYTTPSVSANGASNAIAWVIQTDAYGNNGPSVLHAFNATNLAQELYNSSQNLARDNPGGAVKYAVPVVANGKVYVRGEYTLAVFGLGPALPAPIIAPNGGTFSSSVAVTLTDASNNAAIYYTLDGTAPTTNSFRYTSPFTLTNTVAFNAIAAEAGVPNSPIASASFIDSAAAGSGTGLMGAYWTNTSSVAFTNATFAISPTLVRTDATVNFNWDGTGPDPSIGSSNYAVRWTGSVQPQFNESYTFYTTADDGVRLYVNGRLLIDDWSNQPATVASNTINLAAQELYNIELDYYYQNDNGAKVALSWSSPSTPQAVIPQTQLYPYTNPPPTVVISSPADGSVYTATASVSIGATADAPRNPIAKVDFYTNGNLLGTLTSSADAPLYALTTTGLNPGSYTLTAVATDGSGLAGTSAPVHISVTAGSGLPYGLTSNGTVTPFLNMPSVVPAILPGSLPLLLSETGAFTDTTNRVPAGGLVPYAPNTPLWSDNAVKSRYMAVPNQGGLITPDEQIAFLPTNSWTFPAGTVFVKNFDLVVNLTNASVPLRRLETRLLVRDLNGAVYGVTYKWRPDNSDADLLTTSSNETIFVTNATGVFTQQWYYPSPADCLTCHTPVANYVLGVNTRQLNGDLAYPATGNTDNQLRTLNRLGLFYPAINEANITSYAALSALTNVGASFQERARSYLDANCSQCHQPGGTGITFDARYDTPLPAQNITNYPAQFSLGFDNACVIKDMDIWRSMIYQRMNTTNAATKMPNLARNLIDTNAVQVMAEWINSLPGTQALPPPTITPDGGAFSQFVTVALQASDTNATVYYTLDGTLPTTNSARYSAPLLLTNSVALEANEFETNFNNSIAAGALFDIQPFSFTSMGFTAGHVFVLELSGAAGSNYVLQATTNFINWTPLVTNLAASNIFNLQDPGASNFPYRFYRVIQQ
jgi:hypothetical protein